MLSNKILFLYFRSIPQELIKLAQGGEVALDMEDHRDEDYIPPKQPKIKAFSGAGNTLGGVSTPVSTYLSQPYLPHAATHTVVMYKESSTPDASQC